MTQAPIPFEHLGEHDYEMYEGLPLHALKTGRWLLGLYVPPKRRGGNEALLLMAEACWFADKDGRYLFLQAYPLYDVDASDPTAWAKSQRCFERDRERLVAGYSQFGFILTGGGYMYRPPHSPTDWATKRIFPTVNPYLKGINEQSNHHGNGKDHPQRRA